MATRDSYRDKEGERCARKADKLRAEIDQLSDKLYNLKDRDPWLRCENLKTYRSELLRGFIVHLHLAIEDLLKALLFDFLVKRNRSLSRKAAIRIVDDMKSSDILQWCGRLKLVTKKQYEPLLELNRIRNACAHKWIIDAIKNKRIMKGLKKRRIPAVIYRNKNLFDPELFANDFCPLYGSIYLKLLWRVWRVQGKL